VRSIEREAVRLALEHGPAALTVDQICEAVGISQRNFFNHFDTKDDALLGWELPHLSEERVRIYLDDPTVGILSGALTLVEPPTEMLEERELVQARFRVMLAAPWLATRQIARMLPVTGLVAAVVEQKLRLVAGPEIEDERIRSAAAVITAMAAALVLQRHRPMASVIDPGQLSGETALMPIPDPAAALSELDQLRWIWDRLI
jgi:AcrR family transcriptional regulator